MTQTFGAQHKPVEIRVKKDEKLLEIQFDDGVQFRLPAELLRVESPSAEVQGHGPSQKKVVAGRKHVNIIGVDTVGSYAVRLTFDDMHDSGLYTWDKLYDFGVRQDELWENYLKAIEKQGLSRDP